MVDRLKCDRCNHPLRPGHTLTRDGQQYCSSYCRRVFEQCSRDPGMKRPELRLQALDFEPEQMGFELTAKPFDDPQRDELRRQADRLQMPREAELLNDPNPSFEPDAKRQAAARVRQATPHATLTQSMDLVER
jgi:hypothetical protein